MQFDTSATINSPVTCKLITIYPEEDRIEVGWKFAIDQEVRKTNVTPSTAYNETNLGELTEQLSRAVVKAIKDIADIDVNTAMVTPIFWNPSE